MKLPNDYFFDTDKNMVDYLEKNGLGAIDSKLNSNRLNRERAEKILHYLLIGLGTIALLLINKPELLAETTTKAVIIMLLVGWGSSIGILVGIVLKEVPHAIKYNSPAKLYNPSFKQKDNPSRKLLRLRQLELINQSKTIVELGILNRQRAFWNRIALYCATLTTALSLMIFILFG